MTQVASMIWCEILVDLRLLSRLNLPEPAVPRSVPGILPRGISKCPQHLKISTSRLSRKIESDRWVIVNSPFKRKAIGVPAWLPTGTKESRSFSYQRRPFDPLSRSTGRTPSVKFTNRKASTRRRHRSYQLTWLGLWRVEKTRESLLFLRIRSRN